MTAFTAAAWTRRWEAAGGGWSVVGGKLWFLLPDEDHACLDTLLGELVGHRDRLAAVKLYAAGQP